MQVVGLHFCTRLRSVVAAAVPVAGNIHQIRSVPWPILVAAGCKQGVREVECNPAEADNGAVDS